MSVGLFLAGLLVSMAALASGFRDVPAMHLEAGRALQQDDVANNMLDGVLIAGQGLDAANRPGFSKLLS